MVGEAKTPEALRNAADHFVLWKKPDDFIPEIAVAVGNGSNQQGSVAATQEKPLSVAAVSLHAPSAARAQSQVSPSKPHMPCDKSPPSGQRTLGRPSSQLSVQHPESSPAAPLNQAADPIAPARQENIKQYPGFVLDAIRAILSLDEPAEASGVKRKKVHVAGKQGQMVFAVDLPAIGQHLRKQNPGFSARVYGHKTLANLLKGFPALHVVQEKGGASRVCLRDEA